MINNEILSCRNNGIQQPPENTHASLVQAMQSMDGVEFDLRLTADDQVVVHHDHTVSVSEELLDGRPRVVEEWDLAELENLGFCSFEKLMSDRDWLVPWQEHSKVACLEIKRCLPEIEKEPTNRMARIMELASEMVDRAVYITRLQCFMRSTSRCKK